MSSEAGSGNSASSGSEGFTAPSTEDLDKMLDAYEFIGILGQGGMGAVYKARQKSLDREVAIKILPASLSENDEGVDEFRFADRFQREARAMAKLSHPNIISVFDFGQASDGQLYIVMEYIDGPDLHELIHGGEMTTEHVLGWSGQICDALQYAHSRGIVHRDIKPANVMISLEGQVKIADFGLAKLTGAGEVEGGLTMTNMAMGTPDYIAPEALEQGIDIDHRADLYAVGVMLYEMFTGKVPRGAWKTPSSQVPGLDSRYDDLVAKAMDSDREDRFQNATDISTGLFEISASSAVPLTGGGKTLITGDAATAATSGRVSIQDSGTDSDVATIEPKSNGRKIALIGGGIAALLAVAGFFLLSPSEEPVEVAAPPTEPASTTVDQLPPSAAPAEMVEVAPVEEPTPETKLPEVVAEEAPSTPAPAETTPADSPPPKPEPAMAAAATTPADAPPEPPAEAPAPRVGNDPQPTMPKETPPPAKAPSAPDDPRLVSLEEGFQRAFERDANAAFLAGVATLDQGYGGALDRASKAARTEGALDDVVAIRKEQQNLADKVALPESDEPGLPKALVSLRSTYREAFSKLQADRDAATLPLYDKYLEALQAYEAELTKQDAIEKALALREYQKQIVARRAELVSLDNLATETMPETVASNTPATPNSAPIPTEVESTSSVSRRELAEWLLTGDVKSVIDINGRPQGLETGIFEEIPKGDFIFKRILIGGGQTGLTDADLNRLSAAPELLVLEFHTSIPAFRFPFLRDLQNLETLKFNASPNLVVEGLFADIASIPTLKEFVFRPREGTLEERLLIPTEELRALSDSRSLEIITFSLVIINSADLAELAAIPTLQELELARVRSPEAPLSLSALSAFVGHPSLVRLDLDKTPVKPEDFAVFGQLEKLEILSGIPADPNVNDDTLALLAPLGDLQELEILDLKANGTGFADFKSAGSMRRLDFGEDTTLNDAGLGVIADTFKKLEYLGVRGENFGKAGIEKIASLNSLQELHLRCSPDLTGDAFEPLSSMNSLLQLHLTNGNFDATALSNIAELGNLQRLEINGAGVDVDGFSTLGKLRNLKELVLRDLQGGFHDEWIPTLKKMRSLNFFYAPGNGLSSDGEQFKKLRDALPPEIRVNGDG